MISNVNQTELCYSPRIMRTVELEYDLPERLIAQHPADRRDSSRLLVVDRGSGRLTEDTFRNLPKYLSPGDCLALNDTRVIRARLYGQKDTGGKVEIFLLRENGSGTWESLVNPSSRVKPGTQVRIGDSVTATVEDHLAGGRRAVRFNVPNVLATLESTGEIPLPPYIRREEGDARDAARYQTIYARHPGAVAAPTAGLHFSSEVFDDLEQRGIRRGYLTLHVGYGTFKPVTTNRVEDHQVEPEQFELPEDTAALLDQTRAEGGKVVSVGTTCTRVLETQYYDRHYRPGRGVTKFCIFPPYEFRGVDTLLTNFHLPRSSLLALVCAFAGKDLIFEAYRHAVEHDFRFYSYGDAMLIR